MNLQVNFMNRKVLEEHDVPHNATLDKTKWQDNSVQCWFSTPTNTYHRQLSIKKFSEL